MMQLFEITTTVDPSYIISLIRKLLPSDARKSENTSTDSASNVCVQQYSTEQKPSDDKFESMDIVDDTHSFAPQEGESKDSMQKSDRPQVATGEEVWEDCGCILWDLAANKTHAELMVYTTCFLFFLLVYFFHFFSLERDSVIQS